MFHSLSMLGSRLLVSLIFLLMPAFLAAGSASAQDRRQNAPGEFDFYVLALSWSPSFCEAAEERGTTLADPEARKIVYGMPYDEWRAKYQKEAYADQQKTFGESHKH